MNKFKVGDKVYCPALNNKIHQLDSFIRDGVEHFNIVGYGGITNNGLCLTALSRDILKPVIIKATEENHALLEKLYGVDFEKPPVHKDPKEIIKAMLEKGQYRVPIVADGCLHFVNSTINHISRNWDNVYPFDPKTGKKIINFVNGEVVLED